MAKLDENDRRQLSATLGGMGYPGAPNLYIFAALYVSGELIFRYSDAVQFGPDLLAPLLVLLVVMAILGACMSYCLRTIPKALKGRTDGLAADVWWYGVQLLGSLLLLGYAIGAVSRLEQDSTVYMALGITVVVAMFFLVSKGKPEGNPEDFGK